MTKEDKEDNENFKKSTKCCICNNDYVDGDVKVRDHCHITGKYRASAYRDYNINVKLNQKIFVVFHNLKNYDSSVIMQELGKFNLKIKVIPNELEKYMNFSINSKLSFIGNFEFLSSSLDSLVKNLGKQYFKYLSQEFDNNVLDLVKQKVLYPHEHLTDFKTFKKQLPSKEKFHNLLTGKKISDKEYDRVLKVWNKFKMKTMKDYRNLYIKCEVLPLADVFKKFRNNSIKNYGLRPSHYLGALALSWDTMLNRTKAKLELISDLDMYIFPEKGMRGGISYTSNRDSKANNKYSIL